jgi:type I restriction enzyme S subunit
MNSEWSAVPLGQVVSISLSGVDKHIVSGEVPVLLCNYLDVYRNSRLARAHDFSIGTVTPAELARFRLRKGDVLITKDSETPDDIGIPSVVVDDLDDTVCGYHLALLRPTDSVDSLYLSYQLQSDAAKRHFLRTATGLTRFGLGMRAIATLPIPLPPPKEQAAIARVVDAVDTAIERTRAAVERAQDVRKSLLDELLIRGIGNDGRVRIPERQPEYFVRTSLGLLPTDWKLSSVGSEFDLQTGFTLNEGRRPRNRRRRYLRVANVQRDSLDLQDIAELEASDSEFFPRVLQENDLLVVEGHADRLQIGRCARVTTEAAGLTFQNHLFRLRSSSGLSAYFGCLWLNSTYARKYWNAKCATSSGLNTINQRMLKRFIIPVPPKPEQEAITEVVAAQRAQIDAIAVKRDRLIALKASVMHDLLTGKVRVNSLNVDRVLVP